MVFGFKERPRHFLATCDSAEGRSYNHVLLVPGPGGPEVEASSQSPQSSSLDSFKFGFANELTVRSASEVIRGITKTNRP